MFKISSRADYVEQMGVKDDAMRLTELQSTYLSRDFEVVAGVFTDYRDEREYPDFRFAVMYPRSWSAELVRMDLFAWLASAKAAYNANAARFLC
jgi:hypothetical protein